MTCILNARKKLQQRREFHTRVHKTMLLLFSWVLTNRPRYLNSTYQLSPSTNQLFDNTCWAPSPSDYFSDFKTVHLRACILNQSSIEISCRLVAVIHLERWVIVSFLTVIILVSSKQTSSWETNSLHFESTLNEISCSC